MEENEMSKKNSIKNILRWIFSIIFILSSINSAINNGWLGVILFGLSGILLCPFIENQFLKYIPNFPKSLKIVVIVAAITLVSISTFLYLMPNKIELSIEENTIVNCFDDLSNRFDNINISNAEKYEYNNGSINYYITFNYSNGSGIRISDVAVYTQYSSDKLEYITSFKTENKDQSFLNRVSSMTQYLDEEGKNRVINSMINTYYASDKGIEEQDYDTHKKQNKIKKIDLSNIEKKFF